jgi:branched-chain amino acid transport system ATP-binding protein
MSVSEKERLRSAAPRSLSSAPILRAHKLGKKFSGFTAVEDVDLAIAEGSIHALVGPNGAGKTTCFNLLSKFLEPSSGDIFFRDRNITRMRPADVARLGMVRSFQISATFPHMTLLENVRVVLQRAAGLAHQFWMPARALARLDDEALRFLEMVGLSAQAGQLASSLPYGHKRALELVTTLAMDPRLLLLDEPTQGLGHEDVEQVTELIRRVAQGRTVLMVEHNMSVISKICDRVTVMQRGQVLAEGSYDEVSRNPEVIAAYMGDAEEEMHG